MEKQLKSCRGNVNSHFGNLDSRLALLATPRLAASVALNGRLYGGDFCGYLNDCNTPSFGR